MLVAALVRDVADYRQKGPAGYPQIKVEGSRFRHAVGRAELSTLNP